MDHPHISCKNHNLSLESNLMVKNNDNLRDVTEKVTAMSAAVRDRVKCSTALRNVAVKSNPKLGNVRAKARSVTCQWLGEHVALKSHIKLKEYLAKLVRDDVGRMSEFQETVETSFILKCQLHEKYLSQIRTVSVMMQKGKLSLCHCQSLLNRLMKRVRTNYNDPNSLYYKCKLGKTKIVPKNGLSTHPHFETGVAKIQEGVAEENKMTYEEIYACRSLLKSNFVDGEDHSETESESSGDESSDEEDIVLATKASMKRKAKAMAGLLKYINSKFILGSATCVEQRFSIVDAILIKRRLGLSPFTLELILFLKENRDLWNISDVVEANRRRLDKNRQSRVTERIGINAKSFMCYLDVL